MQTELFVTIIMATMNLTSLPAQGRYIYWTDGADGKIYRGDDQGISFEEIIAKDANLGISPPQGLAIDAENEKLYWTDWGVLWRANLNGSSIELLANVACGIGELAAIELDVAGGKMYWISDTDCGGPLLNRANLDGTLIEENIIAGSPVSFALDIGAQKVYWINNPHRPKSIRRANLDGSFAELLVDSLDSAFGIALDVQSSKMYWTEVGRIRRANLDGTEVETLITGLNIPFDIALDVANQKLYWSERNPGKIRRALTNGTQAKDLFSDLAQPDRIALTFESDLVNRIIGEDENLRRAQSFVLQQNYPNPFNQSTQISYDLVNPTPVTVRLIIYDTGGRQMKKLVDEEQPAGRQNVWWDGTDDQRQPVSSGAYIYRLEVGDVAATRKLLLLK